MRIHDSTVATVFRVNKVNGKYYSTVVNIYVLGRQAETKIFSQQAIDIKLLIERYNPREVLIDTNGLVELRSFKIPLTAGKPLLRQSATKSRSRETLNDQSQDVGAAP